jgi:hypothetical protein
MNMKTNLLLAAIILGGFFAAEKFRTEPVPATAGQADTIKLTVGDTVPKAER